MNKLKAIVVCKHESYWTLY